MLHVQRQPERSTSSGSPACCRSCAADGAQQAKIPCFPGQGIPSLALNFRDIQVKHAPAGGDLSISPVDIFPSQDHRLSSAGRFVIRQIFQQVRNRYSGRVSPILFLAVTGFTQRRDGFASPSMLNVSFRPRCRYRYQWSAFCAEKLFISSMPDKPRLDSGGAVFRG